MKLLTAIFIVTLLVSCKTKTSPAQFNTVPFIDTLNLPKDSLAFYFPARIFSASPSSDSFTQNWYSSALYSFKEPLLSRHYVGYNVYRFLWLRSFHRPVVFTLQQKDGQVWLNTKMLNRQPSFDDDRTGVVPNKLQEEFIKEGYVVDKKDPRQLVRFADRNANIIYNKNITLCYREWNEFERLLARANFWHLQTNIEDDHTDGSQWVIEGHLRDKYHVVNYHSRNDTYYVKAGLFLIKLSGLQERIY